MKMLKRQIKKIVLFFRHSKFKKKKIIHKDVTIFSNCCIGGTMYNDLGLKFMSPTINLFFGHHGFIDFVNHYEEYESGELFLTDKYDVNERGAQAPVCLLKKNNLPDIEIHFLHYDKFDDAKTKWQSRYKRINKKKIFLVIEVKDSHEYELIEEYVKLPYPKIIFTNLSSDEEKHMKHMKVYDKNNKKSVTEFINIFGVRGYDEYDFVSNIFNRDY